jgi:hypothetical protein
MISFDSVLVNDRTIVRKERVLKSSALKIVEDTSVRTFIKQFSSDFDVSMFGTSAVQDAFNHINIPLQANNISYNMTFAGIAFEAKLDGVSAAIRRKKDGTYMTTYTFTFVKEIDPSVDGVLSSSLKNKETDEKGKKKLIQYATTLDKI